MRLVAAILLSVLAVCMESRTAHAGTIRTLPVPAETIYPGQAITAAQLTGRKFQTTANSLNGIATDESEITGQEALRRLPAGKPIPLSALHAAMTVKRGATAVASYDDAGLSISMPVTILQDGAAGDVIDARNMSTGALIKVVVLADGGVKVGTE